MNFQGQKFSPRGLHPTGYKIIIPLRSSVKSKPSVPQKRYFLGKSVAPLPKNPRLINTKARGLKKGPAKPTRRKVPTKKNKRKAVKRAPLKKKKKGYRKPAKKVKKKAKKRPQKKKRAPPKKSLAKKRKKKGLKRTIFD